MIITVPGFLKGVVVCTLVVCTLLLSEVDRGIKGEEFWCILAFLSHVYLCKPQNNGAVVQTES